MCQAKFNLPAYLGRDCGGNSLARIEGLSAGIVGGWGQARPARLNRFEGTTQVYCLRKDFLELTGKTRSGTGKSADAKTVAQIPDLETLPRRVRESGLF